MKIKIALTVDIDPAAWDSNYGISGATAIRDDVRQYVAEIVRAQLEAVGVLSD